MNLAKSGLQHPKCTIHIFPNSCLNPHKVEFSCYLGGMPLASQMNCSCQAARQLFHLQCIQTRDPSILGHPLALFIAKILWMSCSMGALRYYGPYLQTKHYNPCLHKALAGLQGGTLLNSQVTHQKNCRDTISDHAQCCCDLLKWIVAQSPKAPMQSSSV